MPSASTAPSSTALPSPSPSLSSPSPATPKLRRILIANRGEIAMRVIHACHDTGRIAIAAYADPDADALFVHAADEAYALGGSDAQSTYSTSRPSWKPRTRRMSTPSTPGTVSLPKTRNSRRRSSTPA